LAISNGASPLTPPAGTDGALDVAVGASRWFAAASGRHDGRASKFVCANAGRAHRRSLHAESRRRRARARLARADYVSARRSAARFEKVPQQLDAFGAEHALDDLHPMIQYGRIG